MLMQSVFIEKRKRKKLFIVPSIWILYISLSSFEFIFEIITKVVKILLISNNTLDKTKNKRYDFL